jgi:tRNA1Val (adenine37-N6)-methyltransferase
MSNSFFQFKQFIIRQDQCAMKVCTEACLFGAWLAAETQKKNRTINRVLDVGAGTGLLSLMYAQKNSDANIDAVEIDEGTALQGSENFAASPWQARLKVYNKPIQEFSPNANYDIIISNPPFFENALQSNSDKRNVALHSTELSLEELLNTVTGLLGAGGSFFVLLPFHRANYFEALAKSKGFHPAEKVLVKQTPLHDHFRGMFLFTREAASTRHSEIIIKDEQGKYTEEFTHLLKDYYLYL